MRQGTNDGLEQNEASVIGTDSLQHTLVSEAFGGGQVHSHLSSYLGSSQPASAAKMMDVGVDPIGFANLPNDEPCETVFPPGPEPTGVKSSSDLSVCLFGGKCANEFDSLRRRPNQIRGAQRQRSFQRCGCTAFPADVDLDVLPPYERDVFDQKPEHALAISSRRARVIPHPRKVGSQRMNAIPVGIRKH